MARKVPQTTSSGSSVPSAAGSPSTAIRAGASHCEWFHEYEEYHVRHCQRDGELVRGYLNPFGALCAACNKEIKVIR